jgi:putative FmdB family regulatory protein
MPTYDYRCPECGFTEEVFLKLHNLDRKITCECGTEMQRIISKGHGGTHGDEAPWIESTNVTLTSPGQEPIKTRKDYKERLKETGFVPTG